MSLYFALLLGSVAVPLALSFDKRLQFYKQWKYVFPSIITISALYIVFDVWLTKMGVWGFNSQYLSGIYLLELPIEEWLFFVVIAYASLFLHFSVVEYFPNFRLKNGAAKLLTLTLVVFSLAMVFLNIHKTYTVYIFVKMTVVLLLALLSKSKALSAFYATFLVILVPFVIVNGVLTGSFIDGEVVWYNNAENLGIRFFTIPVEDFAYAFTMLLFNLLLLDKFKEWREK